MWSTNLSPDDRFLVHLPERAALEGALLLELLDRLVVDTRAQVLPAVVGSDEDDIALVELLRHAHADRGDRAGGHAYEEALLLHQLLRPDDRVAVRDEDLPVQQREVDDRRDVAVLE